MSDVSGEKRNGELVVDSRLIAESLGIAHQNLLATINKYQIFIESAFGIIAFEKGLSERGRKIRFAWLTEKQATFLLALSANSGRVVDSKFKLARGFLQAKHIPFDLIPLSLFLLC